jgi:hypothetical protein
MTNSMYHTMYGPAAQEEINKRLFEIGPSPSEEEMQKVFDKFDLDRLEIARKRLYQASIALKEAAEFGNAKPGSNAGSWDTLAREIAEVLPIFRQEEDHD